MSNLDNKSNTNDKEKLLANGPILKTMLKLGIPSFLAQFINLLYNIVDRIYIGHIPGSGAAALTALGICFPILSIIMAFASLVGAGGAPLAGIAMGGKDRAKAEKLLGNGVSMLLIFSLVLTILFELIKKPFLYMFGASDATYPYAGEYLTVYLLGTVFVLLSLGLNSFIIVQGQAGVAMLSVVIGAACNIIFDPLFIFGLNMGVKGAAFATIISQCVSMIWVLKFLNSDKASLKIKMVNLKPDINIMKDISALGVSPFIMAATESIITIVFNTGAQKYGGDLYVGSITILQSVLQVIFLPLNGFTQGVQPLISYNYGAKNYERVRKTAYTMLLISFLFAFSLSGISILLPGEIASIFTDDAELIVLCRRVLPIFISGMLVFGLQTGSQNVFMGMGRVKESFFFAIFRKIILLTPLAIVLPIVTKSVYGLYYSEPISDSVSALCCFFVVLRTIKRLKTTDFEQK